MGFIAVALRSALTYIWILHYVSDFSADATADLSPSAVTVWVSSTVGSDTPSCGAAQTAPCATIDAAFNQCGTVSNCSLYLEPGTYTGTGNTNLLLERAAIANSCLAVKSWPCASSGAMVPGLSDCANAPRALISCSASNKGWLLSASSVVLQGLLFDQCQTPFLNATLMPMYSGPTEVPVGSALLFLNSTVVQMLDVTVQAAANGYAVAVFPGDPRVGSGDATVSNDLTVTLERCVFLNNTGGAFMATACLDQTPSYASADSVTVRTALGACACNAAISVSNCTFAGNTVSLSISTPLPILPALLITHFPTISKSNLTVDIYFANSSASDRTTSWSQFGSRLDARQSSECSTYALSTRRSPTAPDCALCLQSVTFKCVDPVICTPDYVQTSRLVIAWHIVHSPDVIAITPVSSIRFADISFYNLFRGTLCMEVLASGKVFVDRLRVIDSLWVSLGAWSMFIDGFDLQHIKYPVSDLGLDYFGMRKLFL